MPLNYWNIYLKSQGVLQANNLGQKGSAVKKSLKTPGLRGRNRIGPLQTTPSLHLKSYNPAAFSSNPNQTHLKQLIKAFMVTLQLQAGVLEQVWNWSLQDGSSTGAELEIHDLVFIISVFCGQCWEGYFGNVQVHLNKLECHGKVHLFQ